MTETHSSPIPSDPAPNFLATGAGHEIAYHRLAGKSPAVMFLGGFMSDMGGTKAAALETHCRAVGRAFLRFDYSGHGQSGGTFRAGTIGGWLVDSLAVIDRLTKGALILVGSSMGGWLAVLAALARPERVRGLITIASAPDFTERLIWNDLNQDARGALARNGYLEEPSPYTDVPRILTHDLVTEGRGHLILGKGVIPIKCPMRLFHGLADIDVPWALSRELLDHVASHDATLTLIKGGDHRLSTPGDLARLTGAVEELAALGIGEREAAGPH